MEFYNTFEPRSAHRTVLKRCSQWVEEEQGPTPLYACVFRSPPPKKSPLHGALRALFIEGTKACRRSLALCPRRQWRLWWRRCRRSPDHRQRGTHLGRLARRALAGAVWHAARLVRPLACLCSEQAKYDSACAMMACLGSLRIPLRRIVHPVSGHLMLANIPSRCGTIWRHML